MCEVRIGTRMPKQRHRELFDGKRQRKTVQPGTHVACVTLGYCADQIGLSNQRDRRRKAPYDDGHVPLKS